MLRSIAARAGGTVGFLADAAEPFSLRVEPAGEGLRLFGQAVDADHLSHTLLPDNAFTKGMPQHGWHLADELTELIALHDASNIAAVIVEPMAGSTGVIPPPAGYLQRLQDIVKLQYQLQLLTLN